MNLKKIAAMAMSTVMALSMGCMTAFAAYPTTAANNQTLVLATVKSAYTLVIPQKVYLVNNGAGSNTYDKDFNVTVKGDIAETEHVEVTTAATFAMESNNGNASKTATVTNTDMTTWNRNELLADTGAGTAKVWNVSAPLTPGTWAGLMTYNCALNDSPSAGAPEAPVTQYDRSADVNAPSST